MLWFSTVRTLGVRQAASFLLARWGGWVDVDDEVSEGSAGALVY